MPETAKLPITRIIHVTLSFMSLKCRTHWSTETLTVLNAISWKMSRLLSSKTAYSDCRHSDLVLAVSLQAPSLAVAPYKLDWFLLLFTISCQNNTSISGVWNMTGCFWWIISAQLEWRGWVLDKQKYLKYLINRFCNIVILLNNNLVFMMYDSEFLRRDVIALTDWLTGHTATSVPH